MKSLHALLLVFACSSASAQCIQPSPPVANRLDLSAFRAATVTYVERLNAYATCQEAASLAMKPAEAVTAIQRAQAVPAQMGQAVDEYNAAVAEDGGQ